MLLFFLYRGDASTVLTIKGTGFSETDCVNVIHVGDYLCAVQSSTSSELQCKINTANSMPVGEPQAVSVNVKNRGRALNEVTSPAKQGFTLQPRIDSLSMHEGSRRGGTEVTVTGIGFAAKSMSDVSLWIGNRGCLVQSVTYTKIVCITTSTDTGRSRRAVGSELRLEINAQRAVCSGNCNFDFSDNLTPEVDEISPNTVTGESTSIVITGSRFSSDTSLCKVTKY